MHNKIKFLITIVLLASINVGFSQTIKEQKFNTAVKDVIQAFSKQDSVLLSKYTNKENGVTLLHRIGVFDTYTNFNKISFSNSNYPFVLFRFPKEIQSIPIRYEKLPKFDCEKEWNKSGLFVDTTRIDHLLSRICKTRNQWVPDSIPIKKIESFVLLENRSRRVVLINRNKEDLIFYLTYMNGKWYLTILDKVTSDCSV